MTQVISVVAFLCAVRAALTRHFVASLPDDDEDDDDDGREAEQDHEQEEHEANSGESTLTQRSHGKRRSVVVDVRDISLAERLDTHPALVDRAHNRPHTEQLRSTVLSSGTLGRREQARLDRANVVALSELEVRLQRERKLANAAEHLQAEQNTRAGGHVVRVREALNGKPAQFKWKPERKK